ncbi:MAG: site-specific integrase [Lachnospiraceae bacterium]|nr:site-specific integrase [Lachnospiraceae bacterium]
MMSTNDFAKHLTKFFTSYLSDERRASAHTIASYRDAMLLFIEFMKDSCNIHLPKMKLESITKARINDFLKWLREKRNCSDATCNYRLAAIHAFVGYVQYNDVTNMEEWQKILAIQPVRTESKSPDHLSVEGVKLLLEQPDVKTASGRRHLAILAVMYGSGARVQEVVDLTLDSLRIETKPYSLRLIGKGKKARLVPLASEVVAILRKYMADYNLCSLEDKTHPLFFNKRGEKLTRGGISHILSVYASNARLKNPGLIPARISCHSLRHSKAMHLLQSGVNLVYIRDILGHASIQSTDVYARADSSAKRAAIEKAYTPTLPSHAESGRWESDEKLKTWLRSLGKSK